MQYDLIRPCNTRSARIAGGTTRQRPLQSHRGCCCCCCCCCRHRCRRTEKGRRSALPHPTREAKDVSSQVADL